VVPRSAWFPSLLGRAVIGGRRSISTRIEIEIRSTPYTGGERATHFTGRQDYADHITITRRIVNNWLFSNRTQSQASLRLPPVFVSIMIYDGAHYTYQSGDLMPLSGAPTEG
jgi:hypothetical protein